ncbi:MAG: hypothetical protein KDB00_00300, partial [Planctomycetales bacterium]|nr:hypothetical protein [Planctomycetales bacterium]
MRLFDVRTLCCSILVVTIWPLVGYADGPSYTIELAKAHSGFDGQTCWVQARAGAIPGGAEGNPSEDPLVILTTQKLLLTGSDVFYRLHQTRTVDGADTWSELEPIDSFTRETVGDANDPLPTGASIAPHLLKKGDETTVCDFQPKWHAASQRLLGIGQSVWYRDNRVMHVRPRGIAYAVYQPSRQDWSKWKTVELPSETRFQNAGSGSAQRVDLPGGDVLIPFYFKEPSSQTFSSAVCKCRFDGHTLHYIEHGNAVTVPTERGLYEPSLTRHCNRFYLTLRNDDRGYVSVSDDGLNFSQPKPWTFDDGKELGSYNTQQHWITHGDELFLVYTRRGANNDHVFRNRAPLFIAQIDVETLTVVRNTEQILVPERGARLGNFGIVDVSPDETWVTAAEWMQPLGVEKHGSDNSIFVAKLKWNRTNLASSMDSDATADSTRTKLSAYTQPPQAFRNNFGQYKSPLQFADGSIAKTPQDWQRRRAEILATWTDLLGQWPALITEPDVEQLSSQRRENFTQHQIRFQWTPNEKTTGYLLVPDGEGPHPAVVTVFYEPETAIGHGNPHRDFALQL